MTVRYQTYLLPFLTSTFRSRLLPLTIFVFSFFLISFSFFSSSRAFQTPAALSSLSAASFETNLTPEGIAAGFGSNLAPSTAVATTTPLPTTLNTISVTVNGVNAGLFFVSSGQINYLIPAGTVSGEATVNVLRNGVITHTGKINVVSVAPAIFTANSNGTGVPAAIVLRVATNGAQTTETLSQLVNNRWQTKAINLGPTGERVFLVLFLSGIRNLPNSDGNSGNGVAENVRVLIGGIEQTPTFANKQGGLIGVDQINVEIPRELLGRGKIKATVLGGGFSSLEVEIEIAGATGTNPPTVSSFAPTLATAGETLNINGSGFSATPANNLVRVNGLEALVESASATQLIVRVPYGAEGGRVAVRTTQGEGSSSSDVGLRTTISGLATDTNGNPLPGVEVTYGSIKTTTRNDGTYLLRDVPAGLGTLKLDPSKLPLTPPMQAYSKIAGVTANRDNLQSTTALQTVSGQAASIQTSSGGAAEEGDANQYRLLAPEGTITTGNVTFTFDDNTVGTFPAGITDGRIYLTVLNNSRTPTPLPAGIFSSTIAMLSPFGVKLAPGGKLTFPNSDGLPANTQARLYKLDQTLTSPTLGQFIDVGTATVSADGQRVETGANAITETSIYFAALSRPLTTVTGRVVDSDGTTPVRRALVTLRGQQAFTDGNGSFTLRNIPVPANNLLSIEASFVRPTGRTDSVTRNNIQAVVNGLTRVTPDLVLPSPTTQPNRPPSLTVPTLLTATEGQIRNIPFLVSDSDSTAPVQVTLTSPNFVSVVLIQNIANIRIAPPTGSAGTYPLTIRATDNLNASTTVNATLTVTGNRAPVLIVPVAQTASVGQQLAFNVSVSDPDADQTVTFGATGLPSGATFTQTSATTARFTWTPTANQTGNFVVTFSATDNGTPAMSDRKSVAINVGGITGAQWTQTAGPEGATVRAFVISGTNVFAATDGGIFRSTNDGASWTPASNGLAGQFVSSLANNGTTLFAGTYGAAQLAGAGVFRSTDNGATWTIANNGLSSQNILSLGTNGATVFAGVVAGGVFRSTDNGASWVSASNGLGTQRVYAFATLGNNVFAGTLTGGVFRSADNGANWTPVNTGLVIPSIGALAVSGTTLFAGTNGGGIFRSTDNGATWTPASNGLGIQVVSSLFVNGTTIFAGSLNGGVYRSTDNGATWANASNGLAQQPISALTARGSALLAATFIGVFRSTDNGANWAPANSNLSGQNVLALAINGSNLFAGTINGVFRTTNNGANWTPVNNGLSSPIVLSLLVLNGTVYAGTEGNGVYRTTDNGANWTAANTGLQEFGVTALANIGTTLYAATADAGVYRSTNGTSWTAINAGLGSPHILALVASGNTLFAGTEQAGIYRSTDGGNTWAAASTGLTSPFIYSMGVSGTTLFAGTATGLFRSTDNGATWALSNTGLSAAIVACYVTSGQSIFIGTGFGGVFRSVNNGGLWTPFNEGLTNPFVKALVVNSNTLVAGTIGSSVFTRPLP